MTSHRSQRPERHPRRSSGPLEVQRVGSTIAVERLLVESGRKRQPGCGCACLEMWVESDFRDRQEPTRLHRIEDRPQRSFSIRYLAQHRHQNRSVGRRNVERTLSHVSTRMPGRRSSCWTITFERFVEVNGLSSSTNQRNHTGHGSDWRRDANRHATLTIANEPTTPNRSTQGWSCGAPLNGYFVRERAQQCSTVAPPRAAVHAREQRGLRERQALELAARFLGMGEVVELLTERFARPEDV